MTHTETLTSLASVVVIALLQQATTTAVQARQPEQASAPSNPLLGPSPLPYGAPPFDRIHDGDFQPAIDEGMKQELAEVERIANSTEPPTFANTIEAMERSGGTIRRVTRVFNVLTQSNTNPALQKLESEVAPKLAAHRDAINLNTKLFARINAIYRQRAARRAQGALGTLLLDGEQTRLVERYHTDFVRAGALLSDEDKAALRAINKEESQLVNEVRTKVLADMNASALVVDDPSILDGLPESDLAAAADTARKRGLEGQWVLPLQNTTQQPAQTFLKSRTTRERLFKASIARGNHGGELDTTRTVARLAQLRALRAKLVGFPSYAAFTLDNQMAKTPETALKLMTDMVPAATARAGEEASRMQKLIDAQHGGFAMAPFDWQYYAEQVRKADYELDESQVRPYFEVDRVLRDGVFFAANRLYGLTFNERKDLPVYQSDVRVFEVVDAGGAPLGLFYADYFARSNKRGGGWTSSLVGQNALLGTKAVVLNNCNFTKPAPGRPALLSADEVRTMFHEFGHALHSLLSHVRYPTLSGVPRDFVELPSQFNEHWAHEPAVFANYAKHYQTGGPMPQPLSDKIRKSDTFNQGFATTEYLGAALLDMAWHSLPSDAPLQDVNAFEAAALDRFKIAVPLVPPRYRTPYFSHIWTTGYAAGYYSYIWSQVLDTDAYYWFKEHGGMTRANGQRFRDMILSRGGTEDPAAMYRGFRGRDPSVEPLLIERGLKIQRK